MSAIQRRICIAAIVLVASTSASLAVAQKKLPWSNLGRPFVIGHRGSPAHFPEHTAASYLQAIRGGADFIECDVVLTKDRVPVCRHEPSLSATTNVLSTPLASRRKTYVIDGEVSDDVHTVDLTLAELRTLRAIQKDAGWRPTSFDNLLDVPTLEDYIQIAQRADRVIGIYPEMKHPAWTNSLSIVKRAGTTVQDILLGVLEKYGYEGPYGSPAWMANPVFIQSFEQNDLVDLSYKTCIPLVQLMDGPGSYTGDRNKTFEQMTSDASLDEISEYASGVGPWKNTLHVPNDKGVLTSSGLVQRLQARGMQVHLYTLRQEPRFIYPQLNNNTQFNELDLWFKTEGVDGAFCDTPAICKAYMDAQAIIGNGWPLNQRMRLNRLGKCRF